MSQVMSASERVRKWRERNPELNRERGLKYWKKYHEKTKQKMQKGTRYCRICQKQEKEKEVFANIFDKSHRIALDLYLLSSVVIFETSDQHPALICRSCRGQLNQAVNFKKKILQSEKLFKRKYAKSARGLKYLRALFEKSADDAALEIKEEPMDEEEETIDWTQTFTTENIIEEVIDVKPTELLLLPIPESTPTVEMIELKPEQRVQFRSKGNQDQIVKIFNKFQFVCDFEGCNKSFNEEFKLDLHKKIHSPESFECPVCQRIFNDEPKFNHHINDHKAKALMAFTCDRCGKKFAYKSALHVHMKAVHLPRNQQHICHVCAKIFNNRWSLQSHCKTHYDHEKVFQCENCPARFIDKYKLKRHGVIHTKKKMYECSECPESFLLKMDLTDHRKSVHGIEIEEKHAEVILFKCSQCDQSFKLHRLLRLHQALEHDDELKIPEGKLKHPCKFCSRKFQWKYKAELHMRSRRCQMLFDCFDCKKKFKEKKTFDVHMKKFHGITIPTVTFEEKSDLEMAIEGIQNDQMEFVDELL